MEATLQVAPSRSKLGEEGFATLAQSDISSKSSSEALRREGGYTAQCAGAIQGKEGKLQVLAGLAPSSQTVGSNIRVIHEQV